MTRALSGDSYPTATLILPCLRLVKKRLENEGIFNKLAPEHEGELYYGSVLLRMHRVRHLFQLLLDKRFQNLPIDVKYCCLIDPRFAHGEFLSSEEKKLGEQFLAHETMRLAGLAVQDDDLCASKTIESDEEDDFLNDLFLEQKRKVPEPESPTSPSIQAQALQEVALFFAIVQHDTKEKPLRWWKKNADRFVFLSRVARKFLGIVATSVPSERCFSSAGNVVTARRNRLTGSNIRDIVFVHNNLLGDEDRDAS
jgi:hypothetical protein